MIHINLEGIKLGFTLIAGINPLIAMDKRPFDVYSNEVINFLDRISREIIKKNRQNTNYLNFKGFGFWARKANLLLNFIKGKKALTTYKNILKAKRGNIFQQEEDVDFTLNNIIANNDYLMIKGSNATNLNNLSKRMIKGI